MMKKLFYVIAALSLFACEKAEDFDQPTQGGAASGTGLPEVIYASMADENDTTATRTYADGKTILWHSGDEIAYFGPKAFRARYMYEGEDGAASAKFNCKESGTSLPGLAKPSLPLVVYPYSAGTHYEVMNEGKHLVVYFPTEQTYAPNSFGRGANVMVAAGETADDTDFYFRNACGYLVIKLYGEEGIKIKNIALTALGEENIAGQGYIVASHDAEPRVWMTNFEKKNTVTLNCGDEGVAIGASQANATEFWFALPPVTFNQGFKIVATPTQGGAFTIQTSKKVAITRNDIQPMAALQFVANTVTDYQLFYTRANSTELLNFGTGDASPFDANITAHYYDAKYQRFFIEFDKPLTTINKDAFKNTDITSVTFPGQLTTIGENAFRGTSITSLTLPGSVTFAGKGAFRDCTALTSVSLEANPAGENLKFVLENQRGPFFESKLTNIYLDRDVIEQLGTNELGSYDFVAYEGLFFNQIYNENESLKKSTTTTVTIGSKVTTINPYTFYHLPVKEIIIPSNISCIKKYAFHLSSLERLTISEGDAGLGIEGVTSGAGPFYNTPLSEINIYRSIEYQDIYGKPNANDDTNGGVFSVKPVEGLATSVTIGPKVTKILDFMFGEAPITSITIPGTVTSMGRNAFSKCEKMQTVTFQPSDTGTPLTFYGNNKEEAPFYQAKLQALVLNRKLVRANENTSFLFFAYHSELSSVTLGEQVDAIHDCMFSSTGISSIEIPSSVTSIGSYAIYNCQSLTSVTINGLVYIDDYAFMYDNNLESVNIIGGVTGIGLEAFCSCDALRTFTMNETQSRGEIKEMAFLACPALTAITIPGGITCIADFAFHECTSLSTITFKAGAEPLTIGFYDGKLFGADGTKDHGPFYHSPLTTINLDRNIQLSADYANKCDAGDEGVFSYQGYTNASHQTTVNIGSNVTSIPKYMFATSAATSVTIPATVTSVGEYAFYNCDKLQSAILNSDVAGSNMFDDCDNLTSVTIGGTVSSIDRGMFDGCGKLSTLNITGSVSSIDNGTFDGFNITTINIPGHVNTIGANAFDDCDKLVTLNITGTVNTIGESAFEDCDKLATVNITNTVDKVGAYAFSDCDAVTTLAIRANTVEDYAYEDMDGLKTATLYGATVGKGVFYDSNNLETIIIDGGVNSIGDDAFYNCGKLKNVTFESSANPLTMGYQPSSTDDVGAFYQSPLAYIYLDREIVPSEEYKKQLDAWDMGVFTNKHYKDKSLTTTVTIGSNVTKILDWMFCCVRMQSVEIPASVTSIGKQAFAWDYILEKVTCKGNTAPTLGADVFEDCDELGSITIPAGESVLNDYKSKWSQYKGKLRQ